MFCYQCEQTAKGTGCTVRGVCGKEPEVSAFIDITISVLKDISRYASRLRKYKISRKDIDLGVVEGLFTTVTNVNFDPERYRDLLLRLFELREKAKELYIEACGDSGQEAENLDFNAILDIADDIVGEAEKFGVLKRRSEQGDDITGLQELLLYGVKGAAAYTDHAQILGKEDDSVYSFFHEAMDFIASKPKDIGKLLPMILKCGEVNLKAMELLDSANTGAYGNPVPTKVNIHYVKGKAIVVSGHDLKDLEELLRQTEGKGINVYTHGEMLPAHGYSKLKKHKHLVGNYGTAWQNQQKEFSNFPGAILMTTNCLQKPAGAYEKRIFTSGLVGWPNVTHIKNRNFKPLIESALAQEGFLNDEPAKFITVGFGHSALMNAADKIVDMVKGGRIRHFFLIGGCDGAKPGRNYYTEFAEKVPKDCVILTLACGKYRFNKKDFGEINGVPRLIDIGQCNDAFSAVQIAVALSKAFNCGVNDLPLSFILSWYEQKAVAVLLTLLHLGIKNIRLGPSLPAFVTPRVLNVLVEKFNIKPISTPDEDLKAIFA